jgi:GR25 family glycosyltransferase involved in LPS biosynthesis
LSKEAIDDVGLKVTSDKIFDRFPILVNLDPFSRNFVEYSADLVGKTCYSGSKDCFHNRMHGCFMSAGGIGCYLSHLSVLQDALDSGYDTIWVLEDDFLIENDPRCLSGLIEELDYITENDGGWDILYTDCVVNGDSTIIRPDFPKPIVLPQCKNLERNFMKLGRRFYTHSLIIRRSGMEKILNFVKTHGIFLPYDFEIFLPPNIQIYQTTFSITARDHNLKMDSDIDNQK